MTRREFVRTYWTMGVPTDPVAFNGYVWQGFYSGMYTTPVIPLQPTVKEYSGWLVAWKEGDEWIVDHS